MPPSNEENQEDDETFLATATIAGLTTKVSQLEEELRERNAEVYKLREENEKLKKGRFGFEKIKKSNKDVKYVYLATNCSCIFMGCFFGKKQFKKVQFCHV